MLLSYFPPPLCAIHARVYRGVLLSLYVRTIVNHLGASEIKISGERLCKPSGSGEA
jgi:hypothetical protein